MNMCNVKHLHLLNCLLVLIWARISDAQKDCTGMECEPLKHCIEEVLEPGACCASCLRHGCTCEGYQYYDCVNVGFRNGKVPEGESYFVDSGSTECLCPKGGGNISCHFIPCPELPSNCIDVSLPTDNCPQCGRVGCLHEKQKYEAGHTFHMPPCKVCHCPNIGGQLMCYPLPECNASTINSRPSVDDESESEKHFDDSYSYDQEVPEKDLAQLESPQNHQTFITKVAEKKNIRKVQNAAFDRSESHFTSMSLIVSVTQLTTANGKVSKSMSVTEPPHLVSTTPFSISVQKENDDETDTSMPQKVLQEETKPEETDEDTMSSEELAEEGPQREEETTTGTEEPTEKRPQWGEEATTGTEELTEEDEESDLENETHTMEQLDENAAEEITTGREIRFNPTTVPPVALEEDQSNVADRQSQTLYNYETEEKEDPDSIHTASSMHKVSTKDGIETFCEAGQQWAVDNGECMNMPIHDPDCEICRTAQKQCCVSYLKENSCFAGVIAAKEGDVCVTDELETCGGSFYKQCCDCCSLGLRLKEERETCESNPNLGYPCNNVMLSCCEGENQIIPPEILKEEEPQKTLEPEKVLETEQHNEALSAHIEDEDEHNLVGDDMDECLLYPGQLCKHLCINTVGSYKCGCFPGYALQDDNISCIPDDENKEEEEEEEAEKEEEGEEVFEEVSVPLEIQRNASILPPGTTTYAPLLKEDKCKDNGPCMQVCSLSGDDVECSCFPGFTLSVNGVSCEDINECVASSHTCQRGETCINTIGSFTCLKGITCHSGYERKDDSCVDIDECERGSHNCKVNSVCKNTKGSFYCESKGRCMEGFLQDPQGNCVDINECTSLSEPCKPEFNCINTVGSYTCQRKPLTCSRGYHASEDGNRCVDINECTSLSEPCKPEFNCINTIGSYTCQKKPLTCSRGYHASEDGNRCVDIDECQTGVHRCGEGQVCHNIPGAYRCDCKTGYQYDSFSRTCIDINECWSYPGRLCQQTCENTPGSFRCSCSTGFKLAYDGKHCEDINECESSPCSQECSNVYGSYQCYCRLGYQLAEDGHSCNDIDECTQTFGILCTFRCVNAPGSYQCSCPDHGYTISPNRRSCRDIDECATGNHNCSSSQFCYNIQGDFRCLSVDCPENYRKVSEMRCERISCLNYLACQSTPVRITYYHLNFPLNIVIPSHIFRIGPSPAYAGDNIILSINKGNEEGYFSTRKLNAYTGIVSLQRQVREPKDFLLDVEMKLLRQGAITTFLAKIYVFMTLQA